VVGGIVLGTVVFSTGVPAFATPTHVVATAGAHDPLAGLTADQIAAKALADLDAATSVHESIGSLLSITYARHACAGWFGLLPGPGMDFIQIGKAEWVLLTKQSMAQAGYTKAEIARYTGKWATNNSPSSPLGHISCGHPSSAAFPRTGWTEGRVSIVAGQRAVELTFKNGTAWVSDSSRPEFLKIGRDGSWATFSRYNARVTITPPPASQIVSLPAPPSR
jgi:hypothetical protein